MLSLAVTVSGTRHYVYHTAISPALLNENGNRHVIVSYLKTDQSCTASLMGSIVGVSERSLGKLATVSRRGKEVS